MTLCCVRCALVRLMCQVVPRRPQLAACTAALATAALLSACGGGGSGAEPASGAAASSPTSTPGSAPTSAQARADCGLMGVAADVLQQVNVARARGANCGAQGNFAAAAPLSWNTLLENAAIAHSADMATRNYFSHTSPEGGTLVQRVNGTGYVWSALAENIAAGQASVTQVVNGWLASDGHCANLMNPALRDMALACVNNSSSTYGRYWTLDLGTPR